MDDRRWRPTTRVSPRLAEVTGSPRSDKHLALSAYFMMREHDLVYCGPLQAVRDKCRTFRLLAANSVLIQPEWSDGIKQGLAA